MRRWWLFALLVLTGGIVMGCQSGSVSEKISAAEGKKMMEENEELILVDVRTPEEFAEEHIEGAILLPLSLISSQAGTAIPDKKATYVLYCRSGNRSAQAADLLAGMGYEKLYDMGGIIDWPYDTVSD